jgi:hypothetical protein
MLNPIPILSRFLHQTLSLMMGLRVSFPPQCMMNLLNVLYPRRNLQVLQLLHFSMHINIR